MANNIKGRPWVLDTAGASAVKTGFTYVLGITFSGYTLASHTAVIQDAKRAITLYTLKGVTDLAPVQLTFSEPVPIRDLALTTLGSGVVTIDVA